MQTERACRARRTEHNNGRRPYITGDWYTLGQFGKLKLTIGYYIDTLTVTMFCMVTLIASCVHIYAFGYMHDELHDYVDHEVTLADGHHLHRRGRFHRFFQYLSLFSFSMLGIVHRRQPGDDVRVLGTGRHLLVLPDRLLHRAAQREHGGQQGVHRQPRRRLRHADRPDGALVDARHVQLRRHARTATAAPRPASSASSAREANDFKLVPPDSMIAFEAPGSGCDGSDRVAGRSRPRRSRRW